MELDTTGRQVLNTTDPVGGQILASFKKNLHASKPSEHPLSGERLSKDLGENFKCRDENYSWYQKGSPM